MQMQAGLVPGSYIGMGNFGTGCFGPGEGITLGDLGRYTLTNACIDGKLHGLDVALIVPVAVFKPYLSCSAPV